MPRRSELELDAEQKKRQAIATNPNTSKEVLLELAEEFPREVLDNPVFSNLNIEDSDWLKHISDQGLQALLEHEKIPPRFLQWAVNFCGYTGYEVLMMLLKNPKLSKEFLDKIITDKYFDVEEDYIPGDRDSRWDQDFDGSRQASESSRNLEVAEAAKLHINWNQNGEGDIEEIVKSSMLKITRICQSELYLWQIGVIPKYIFPILRQEVLNKLGDNPYTCASLLGDERLQYFVLKNPNISLELLEKLFGGDNQDIHKLASYHPKLHFSRLHNFNLEKLSVENKYTTSDLLLELAKSQWILIRQQVGCHSNTTVEILEILALDKDYQVKAKVAENSITPVHILEKLSTDDIKKVRESVAKNPNTPSHILEKLSQDKSWKVRKSVAENPSISARLAEKILPTKKRDEPILLALAENQNSSQKVLRYIAKDQKDYIRLSVAMNPSTQSDILELLSTDIYPWVREAVACHVNTPEFVLEKLATDSEVEVRLAVAQNPNFYKQTLEKLAQDSNEDIKETAKNILKPDFLNYSYIRVKKSLYNDYGDYYTKEYYVKLPLELSVSVLEELLEHPYGYKVRSAIASHPNVTVEILEKLARDVKETVRYSVARNKNTPINILEKLANDNIDWVREVVAENDKTPVVILEQLAKDNCKNVRKAVARNISTPIHIIKSLLQDKDFNSWVNNAVTENAILNLVQNFTQDSNLSSDILAQLAQLAQDKDWRLGVAVARHLNTPIQALENLSKYPEWQVRMAVANNLNTPINILEELAQDNNYFVAEDAILSLSWLEINHYIVWEFIHANNLCIDAELLIELARSPLIVIRTLIAKNPNTPTEILDQLATDICEDVRLGVAQNPHTSIAILTADCRFMRYSSSSLQTSFLNV